MALSAEDRLQAAILAPACRDLLRADSQVTERPGWFQIFTPSTRSSILNEVQRSAIKAEESDPVLDRVIAEYQAHQLPLKWCVGPWTEPKDFGQRLERRGFESWEVRGMVIDPQRSLAVPKGVTVEAVTMENLALFNSVFIEGWSIASDQNEPFFEHHGRVINARPQTVHFFLARVDGEPAGTTGLILRGHYAYLVGAQILEKVRGRGLYRALIEVRLAFLRDRGIRLAVTHAREATSAPMLEHLGFETVFRSRCHLIPAPTS